MRQQQTTTVNPEYRAVLGAIFKDSSTHLRERTRESFGNYLDRFFGVVNKPVSKVTYDDVDRFLGTYSAEFKQRHGGRAPRKGTLNNFKAAIKWFYTEGVRIDTIPAEMLKLVTKIKLTGSADVQAEQVQKATISYDEHMMLYNAADGFHRLWLRVAWETIRRPSEVCGIAWEDISFEEQTIQFPLIKVGTRRTAAISRELVEALREWKAKQEAGTAQLKTRWENGIKLAPSKFVFSVGGAKALSSTNIGRWLTNHAARVRLGKKISPHCFRGSGAIYYRRVKGWPMEDVQRQGGWSNSEELVRAYFKDEVHERVKLLNNAEAQVMQTKQGQVTLTPELVAAIAKLAPEAQVIALRQLQEAK